MRTRNTRRTSKKGRRVGDDKHDKKEDDENEAREQFYGCLLENEGEKWHGQKISGPRSREEGRRRKHGEEEKSCKREE
ncbi:hypothetical protein E2C01_015506 [Portunus trituberculatus]|uniref:Uncharacterized protein n=1 Tax=Portunus trituberculatus TaxID=210409 RepID=A0A5B7DLU6_PORTR|nr:hypothetical protein [Portunus trituberculatus]